jgi:hypothetical protein
MTSDKKLDPLIEQAIITVSEKNNVDYQTARNIVTHNFSWLRGSICHLEYSAYLLPKFGYFELMPEEYIPSTKKIKHSKEELIRVHDAKRVNDNKRKIKYYDLLEESDKKKDIIDFIKDNYDCCDFKNYMRVNKYMQQLYSKTVYCPKYKDSSMESHMKTEPHWCKHYMAGYLSLKQLRKLKKILQNHGQS